MKKSLKLFFILISMLFLTVSANATSLNAPLINPSQKLITTSNGLFQKIYHRCYASRCYCRGGRMFCTRDCRRNIHCRFIRSNRNRCGKVYRCVRSTRPISSRTCKLCIRKARSRYILCLRKARSNEARKRRCRYINYQNVRKCKRTVCRRRF